jgi:hypothetical protein
VERHRPDDRSAFAKAAHWSSRIMTIALEMSLPGLAGHWMDERMGTGHVLLIAGVLLGCGVAFWELVRIGRDGVGHDHGNRGDTNGGQDA